MVADGAGVAGGTLGGVQADAALGAGELDGLILLGHGVDGLAADGALSIGTLALVEDHVVAAMGADTAGELFGADVDDVTAGAVDFLSGEEAGLGFYVFTAIGTFHYKFRHDCSSLFSFFFDYFKAVLIK
jgi:hypothetical protein